MNNLRFILAGLGNWYQQWELIKTAVTEAEQSGFWGVALPDHYLWAPGTNDATLDSWVAFAYLAAKTKNIHIGTLVTPIPLRPPAILAKLVSTLDVISAGRVFLGVGAGWSQREFQAYSEWNEPKTRVDKTKEGVQLILKLWTEEQVDFQGKYYHASEVVMEPKPTQKPHPPLLFGGFSKLMLKLAGRFADIIFIPPWIKFSFEDAKDIILTEAKRFGRENRISFATGAPSCTTDYFGLKYDAKRYMQKANEAQENDCEYFVVAFPWETYLDSMRDFQKHHLPSFNSIESL